MTFLKAHPMTVVGIVLIAVLSFLCGAAWGQEPTDSSIVPAVRARTIPGGGGAGTAVPLSLTGAETAVAVVAQEMNRVFWNEQVWLQQVAANMIAEAGRVAALAPEPGRTSPAASQPSGTGGHAIPCGTPGSPTQNPDAIPSHIVQRESQHTVDAWNCSSTASGKYQILDSTFASCGTGYQSAWQAPESVQDECAATLPSSAWGM